MTGAISRYSERLAKKAPWHEPELFLCMLTYECGDQAGDHLGVLGCQSGGEADRTRLIQGASAARRRLRRVHRLWGLRSARRRVPGNSLKIHRYADAFSRPRHDDGWLGIVDRGPRSRTATQYRGRTCDQALPLGEEDGNRLTLGAACRWRAMTDCKFLNRTQAARWVAGLRLRTIGLDRMRRIIAIAISLVAVLVSAVPAFAGIDFNYNESFLRDED